MYGSYAKHLNIGGGGAVAPQPPPPPPAPTPLYKIDHITRTIQDLTTSAATLYIKVSLPEQFTFSPPKNGPRFERFRSTSGLTEKSPEVQVNTLIYSMGDEADDILRSFSLSEAEKKVYDITCMVKEKFENHFVKN